MSYYNTTPAPPQVHEIVPLIAALLRADATLTAALGGGGQIIERRTEAEQSGNNWKRLLVREPQRPSAREAIHNYRQYHFDILIEVHEDVPNPDQFLQAAHASVFALLNGQTISPTKAAVALPVERRTLPTAAAYDPSVHSLYSTAHYLLTLKPV